MDLADRIYAIKRNPKYSRHEKATKIIRAYMRSKFTREEARVYARSLHGFTDAEIIGPQKAVMFIPWAGLIPNQRPR